MINLKDLLKREKHAVITGQSPRFRLVKYIVLVLIFAPVVVWKGWTAALYLLLFLLVISVLIHFFFRWKSDGWRKSWWLYKHIPLRTPDILKEQLDKTYEHPETVPWDTVEPPAELVQLIRDGVLKPCKTLDVGCGNGHHSIYLAKEGFEVTGIDIAGNAIAQARKNAQKQNISATFIELDARDITGLVQKYDFIFEWGLLHFILPEFRQNYARDIASVVNAGGTYLVLTFSEQSPEWGGGKTRTGISGAPLYYSSMEELTALYEPYFEIVETKIRPIYFKNSGNEHLENYLLMKRK